MSSSKKRKLAHLDEDISTSGYATLMSDVKFDIDLEIAMRLRLTETLASRIAWAQSLQDAIKKRNGSASSDNFRAIALNALSMLEAPTRFITDPEPIPPPSTTSQTFIRPPPRKPTLAHNQTEFLYTRTSSLLDDDTGLNELYILKCPDCGRTTFTKLQGLLNHARLRHSLEWGSHDECIRACAVRDNSIDTNLGVEVGIALPGLRTLFRNAVASKATSQMGPLENLASILDNHIQDQQDTGTHLNQTLGLHADTSSLAPFLGKEVIRRGIKVWDGEIPVDIVEDTTSTRANSQRRRWRMPFSQRNGGESFPSRVDEASDKQRESKGKVVRNFMSDAIPSANTQNVVSGQGRFHFSARIIIADRSLSLPEGAKTHEQKDYTHKWMISVDSPSYAHPITSILHSVKVSPSDPTIAVPIPPETTTPPFVVMGLADKPFLARVELSFAGTSSTDQPYQTMVFEHWVDLDPLKLNTVVVGQDQVLDVELDKDTVLQPSQRGYLPIDSKLLWNSSVSFNQAIEQSVQSDDADTIQPNSEPALIQSSGVITTIDDDKFPTLSKIVEQFPLVRSDIPDKRNNNSDLPYTLASSQEEFTSMLLGRRKAIEWRRVRAIRDAYNEQQPTSSVMTSAIEVHKWLSDNGRGPSSQLSSGVRMKEGGNDEALSKLSAPQSMWCNICGLHSSTHQNQSVANNSPSVESTETKPIVPQPSYASIYDGDGTCGIVPKAFQITRLPRADIQAFLSGDKRHRNVQRKIPPMDYRFLVSMTDPQLLLAMLWTANQLNLPATLRALARPSDGIINVPFYPLQTIGENRSEVERHLSPYAILAVATRSFIRLLITRGLEVANHDKVVSTGVASKGKSRRRQDHAPPGRFLTPTHILSGILTRGRGRETTQDAADSVILSCLSKLGIAAKPRSATPSSQGQQAIHVKIEE